jgi:hypothetical protein
MCDPSEPGVLYTDHPVLAAGTPLASLWSYESRSRRSVDRPHRPEYWLHRSDPLLNTMLPGTHVSLVVNFDAPWVTGRSLPSSSLLPAISVIGPFTWPQFLRVGRQVRAIGAVLPSVFVPDIFGVPAPALVNQIVPLAELWPREPVERLHVALCHRSLPGGLMVLRDALLARLAPAAGIHTLERSAARLLAARGGSVSVDRLAAHYGISRQRFGRRFHDAAGLTPKLFARTVRFQGLVHSLLSTDVSQWAAVAADVGF